MKGVMTDQVRQLVGGLDTSVFRFVGERGGICQILRIPPAILCPPLWIRASLILTLPVPTLVT